MPNFAQGVVKFQREVFPEKAELFERLAIGQSPEALFITCSDSRIETAMLTQTDPGELFICRNAGNIVPPHTNQTGAMTASIAFAIGALQIPDIVRRRARSRDQDAHAAGAERDPAAPAPRDPPHRGGGAGEEGVAASRLGL